MKLKQNSRNHLLLEDDLGYPMFLYVGLHPGDVYRLLKYIKGLENRIDELEYELLEDE
jgi:hypothetical protein